MSTALDKFKAAASVPVLATALTFNPAASQDAEAAIVTLDFEQFSAQTQNTLGIQIPDFDESGFHIADSDDGILSAWGNWHPNYAGDVALSNNSGVYTVVTENNETNFRVLSITLSAAFSSSSDIDTDIVLGGIDSLGQSFTQIVTTNGFDLQEIFLGSAFYDVQEFRALHGLAEENFQISSITVDTAPITSTVPIPAAAYFMGSALLGLSAIRRYGYRASNKPELTEPH